ncbi:MAG: sodium:solute symporter family protein [Bacillota bacterium]|nr:sodium:solute symporter family protein [Bacillota bacterium]
MTINSGVVIGMLAAFVVANLVAVKIYVKPQKNMDTYAVGGRKMPWFLVTFTYMSGWYIGSAYTGWVGNSVDIGFFAQYLAVYGLAGLVFLYLLARPVWSWGKFYKLETPSDFMAIRYSKGFGKFYSVFMLIVDGSWLVIEIITLAYIVNVATNGAISLTMGAWLGGIIVGIYTIVGGVNASAITSVIQGFFFVLVGSVFFVVLTYKTYGGFISMYDLIDANKPELFALSSEGGVGSVKLLWITSIITGTLGTFCWPTGFQRLYLASSPRETKKAMYVAPICALVVLTLILMPAMGVSLLPDPPADSQSAEFWLAGKYTGSVGVGLVSIFAGSAAMSTISAVANCISVPFAKDILEPIFKNVPRVTLARITTAAVFLISMIIASIDIPQLNFWAIIFYGFVCQCIVPIVGGVFWKRGNTIGSWLGVIVGCICALLANTTTIFANVPIGGVLTGIALNAIIYIICGFIKAPDAKVEELFEVPKLYDNDGNFYPEENPELAAKEVQE